MTYALALLIAFLFGSFMGSFLNVCIHRLPRNESVVKPGSRCYSCGTHVQWYDNIPLLSYLILRGKCRWCAAPFSIRYVISELMVGALTALAVWWTLDMVYQQQAVNALALATSGFEFGLIGHIAMCAAVVALLYYIFVSSMIDIDHRIIPDELTKGFQCIAIPLACLMPVLGSLAFVWNGKPIPSVSLAIEHLWWSTSTYYVLVVLLMVIFVACLPLAKYVYSQMVPEGQRWRDDDARAYRAGLWVFLITTSVYLVVLAVMDMSASAETQRMQWFFTLRWRLMDAILGSMVGWALPYFVGIFGSMVFRRGAMGYGDVKFLAPIGAFVGPLGVIETFFCAAIVGTVIGLPAHLLNKQLELPFGPYLAIGAVCTLLWGAEIAALVMPGFFIS